MTRGVPRRDAQDARASPLPPPCASPPPQPERLVMRKDEAVGNKKRMQVCLPKHNFKLDNNLLTVEPRAVDPHCFDADPDPDPAQNLDADLDPDPDGGGGGVGQPKMCIPPGKILGTPLYVTQLTCDYWLKTNEQIISVSDPGPAFYLNEDPESDEAQPMRIHADPCGSMRIRSLVRLCHHKKLDFGMKSTVYLVS